ncbi:MAG: DUF3987 domain-containing protein [Kiritimatiellae bacterium]|nr:DUF3987 domain-containing protein [Kiritimatiellia bacterium]
MNEKSPNNLPSDFAHPGGFVEEVMNFINETAVCPQPLFALAAALTLAGLLYGRRVQASDGQRTNIFAMTIGYTSSGKDHALKSIARILDSCNASSLRLGQVTSDSAIEWALKRQPRLCLLIDEAGYFFSGVTDAKAKGSPQHAIKPALLELWSSANSRWVGKQRVPKDGKTEVPPVVIEHPHLCLYSTSQPQILFEGLTRNDLRDGWLARNLFFISTSRPKPTFKVQREVPNTIRAEVFAYKAEGELVTVPDTPEAMAVFTAFNDRIYAKMLAADKTGDEANYLYGKAIENARRVALILAVSRAGDALRAKIEAADAEYATKLVGYLIATVISSVDESLSENADEKAKKRILKIVAAAGVKGITRNELTRKTQFIRRSFREEYLQDLIDGNEIVVHEYLDGYGHGEKIHLAALSPQE